MGVAARRSCQGGGRHGKKKIMRQKRLLKSPAGVKNCLPWAWPGHGTRDVGGGPKGGVRVCQLVLPVSRTFGLVCGGRGGGATKGQRMDRLVGLGVRAGLSFQEKKVLSRDTGEKPFKWLL